MPAAVTTFTALWLIYFGAAGLAPISSQYNSVTLAVLMQASFAVVSILCAWALSLPNRDGPARPGGLIAITPKHGVALIAVSLAFSLLGLAALGFDRIGVQGVDFSKGIAAAREEWRRLGEAREGISSIYSVVGHALSTSYFVALAVIILDREVLPKALVGAAIAAIVALLLGGSLLAGGRTTLLLALAFSAAFLCLRREIKGRYRAPSARGLALAMCLILLAAAYAIYVFAERAAASNEDFVDYAEGGIAFLGGALDPRLKLLDRGTASSLLSLAMLATAYVTHSLYTFAAILEYTDHGGTVLFGHVLTMAGRLGVIPPPDTDWFLAGRFPSLPGALYHTGGEPGLVLGAILLGVVVGLCNRAARLYARSLPGLGAVAACYVVAFLSPLAFAADLMSFPFIVAEFGLVWLVVAGFSSGPAGLRKMVSSSPRGSVRVNS